MRASTNRLWITGALLWSTAAANAQSRPALVELFTSEGCSSCPPAEAYLGELARRPDVLALTFHVDYWDDLGWRDRFGLPESVQRQRGYASALHLSSIYTPQVVIDGRMILSAATACASIEPWLGRAPASRSRYRSRAATSRSTSPISRASRRATSCWWPISARRSRRSAAARMRGVRSRNSTSCAHCADSAVGRGSRSGTGRASIHCRPNPPTSPSWCSPSDRRRSSERRVRRCVRATRAGALRRSPPRRQVPSSPDSSAIGLSDGLGRPSRRRPECFRRQRQSPPS